MATLFNKHRSRAISLSFLAVSILNSSASAEAAETVTSQPTRRHSWRSYRDRSDEYIDARRRAQQQQLAARRQAMERYRSARRWWNNPVAEDRRQWNRARYNAIRQMSDDRSRAMDDWYEQQRDYDDRYRRGPRHHGGTWGRSYGW